MMSDYRVGGSKMSPENRTLGGGWGSRMTPKNRTSFKDVLFVFSKARDLHDSLFGGRRMYIHNKYRQRIVFCWWDCIQSTPLMMRYLKHFYICDFVINSRKSQIQKKLMLFLIKNFKQKIQSIKAKNRGNIKKTP